MGAKFNPDMRSFNKLSKGRKKGVNPKSKGKAGEAYFAKFLSKEIGMSFIRVPNSGAFVGQANRERLKTLTRTQSIINLGDIINPEELKYQFIWESKNYGELDFHNILKPKGSTKLLGWLEELLYDVESAYIYLKEKKPIGFLCVKITRRGSWIVCNNGNIVGTFPNAQYGADPTKWIIPTYPYLSFKYEIKSDILKQNKWSSNFFMCDFESFIKYNKENLFVKIEE